MSTETTVEQPSTESTLEDRIAAQFSTGEEAEHVDENEDEPSSEAVEQAEETAEVVAAEPALEEVEFDGEKFNLPPKIKSALMAQSDYTRKTQEVADQRRMLDAHILMQQQEQQFHQSVTSELNQLQMLDAQMGQFKQLDWSSMDTDTLTRTKHALDQLKDARTELTNAIQGKRGQFDQQMNQLIGEARKRGEQYLKRHIPSFGPDVVKELTAYGQSEGFSDVELSTLTDARMIKQLWKAQQWDKLQSQKATTTKRAEQAPPVLKPGATNTKSAQTADDANYRKAIKAAKNHSERDRIVQQRLEQKLFR
jgi:hypothetical protein